MNSLNRDGETLLTNRNMKNTFEKIIDFCEQENDEEGTLKEIITKSKNRVIRYEWEEKYGIELGRDFRPAEYDYIRLNDHETVSFFVDGYKCHEGGYGRSISWSEGDKQPVNEWVYSVSFGTGSYIFGDDYDGQQKLFHDFFEELRTYKPDYEDLHNHSLYWKVENAKEIMSQFKTILNKYRQLNTEELKARKIAKMKSELEQLENTK